MYYTSHHCRLMLKLFVSPIQLTSLSTFNTDSSVSRTLPSNSPSMLKGVRYLSKYFISVPGGIISSGYGPRLTRIKSIFLFFSFASHVSALMT